MRRSPAQQWSLPSSALAEIEKLIRSTGPAHSNGGLSIHLAELDHYAIGCETVEMVEALTNNIEIGAHQTGNSPYMPQLVDRLQIDNRTFLVVYWSRPRDAQVSEDQRAKELFAVANRLVHNKTDAVVRWCKTLAARLTPIPENE